LNETGRTAAVDRAALLEVFLIEAQECLLAMKQALGELQARPQDEGQVQVLFLMARTIAGSAPSLGLQGAAELAHALQDVVQRVREHSLPVTDVLIALLRRSVDRLREVLPLMGP